MIFIVVPMMIVVDSSTGAVQTGRDGSIHGHDVYEQEKSFEFQTTSYIGGRCAYVHHLYSSNQTSKQ